MSVRDTVYTSLRAHIRDDLLFRQIRILCAILLLCVIVRENYDMICKQLLKVH